MSMEIRVLAKHGKGVREIARNLGLSRNTVRRYLREPEAARYRPRPPRPTKLDPNKPYIQQRLAAAALDLIPATVLLSECRERGYVGSYTMIKAFTASLKPAVLPEPAARFETAAGHQTARLLVPGLSSR
jgi:transposase